MYDPQAWELVASRNGGRLPTAAAFPLRSEPGEARMVGVSIPVNAAERRGAPLASFLLRPIGGGFSPPKLRWKAAQLVGPDARRIPIRLVGASEAALGGAPVVRANFPNPFNPETLDPV